MIMKNKRMHIVAALLFCLLFILSCGGGGGLTVTVITEPNLNLSESSYDFAGVVVQNSADHQFTITNNGTHAGLVINSITSNNPELSITNDCAGQSLAINASCTFIVRFSPTQQGVFAGTVSVASNDPPVRTITLTGNGHGLNVWINKIVSASCPEVVADVTVTNPNGPLNILTANDFTITQNGTTQIISGFTTTDPDSVSVIIALDLSSSLTSAIESIKTAAKYFINQLDDADEAAICKFKAVVNTYPTVAPLLAVTDATGKIALTDYVDLAFNVSEGTALYNAVYDSITRVIAGTKTKKAVLLLSDGANTITSGRTLTEAITYAKAQNVPIFTVYFVDSAHASSAKPAIMKQLATETGGQDFYVDTMTMEAIFGQISALLSKKYTITYMPTSCTGSPLLEVAAQSGSLTGLDAKAIAFP
jgi:VWFA-related protein